MVFNWLKRLLGRGTEVEEIGRMEERLARERAKEYNAVLNKAEKNKLRDEKNRLKAMGRYYRPADVYRREAEEAEDAESHRIAGEVKKSWKDSEKKRKKAEEALKQSRAELEEQKKALERKNVALGEIIEQVERHRDEIESRWRQHFA